MRIQNNYEFLRNRMMEVFPMRERQLDRASVEPYIQLRGYIYKMLSLMETSVYRTASSINRSYKYMTKYIYLYDNMEQCSNPDKVNEIVESFRQSIIKWVIKNRIKETSLSEADEIEQGCRYMLNKGIKDRDRLLALLIKEINLKNMKL